MTSTTSTQLKPFLHHILDEVDYLLDNSVNLSYEEFEEDKTLKRSFVRALEVIGEAVKSIPENFRDEHPHIPWKDMTGMRDILIHRYFGINYKIVWDVAKNQIPGLKTQIQTLLGDLE